MNGNNDTEGASAPEATTREVANTAVTALKNRTKIGKAIVAAGPVDFPLTAADAKALQDLGLVTITGLFAKS